VKKFSAGFRQDFHPKLKKSPKKEIEKAP